MAYTIQKGDTLWKLCSKDCGKDVKKIWNNINKVCEANNIKNPDKIYAGASLDLSCLEGSSSGEAGDTFEKNSNQDDVVLAVPVYPEKSDKKTKKTAKKTSEPEEKPAKPKNVKTEVKPKAKPEAKPKAQSEHPAAASESDKIGRAHV